MQCKYDEANMTKQDVGQNWDVQWKYFIQFLFDEDDNLRLLAIKDTINIHDAVDTIEDDYRVGVFVDVSVGGDVCVDVDFDKNLFPAQMSLLSDVNSRGTRGNPLTLWSRFYSSCHLNEGH